MCAFFKFLVIAITHVLAKRILGEPITDEIVTDLTISLSPLLKVLEDLREPESTPCYNSEVIVTRLSSQTDYTTQLTTPGKLSKIKPLTKPNRIQVVDLLERL